MADRHVPVMLERCVALLAPALDRPGAVVVDATLGLGGHSEALLSRFPLLRLVGLDRDPEAIAASRTPPGRRRRPGHARARGVRPHAGGPRRPRPRPRPGHADGPRRLLAAAGSRRPRLRLRAGRAAGHAHGPDHGHHRGRGPQHLRRSRSRPGAARVRRGAVRRPHRRRRGARAQPGAVRPERAPGVARPGLDPRGRPPDRRQPREAHLPGAADRGQRRAGRAAARAAGQRSPRWRSAGASSCCPTSPSRTGW